MRNTKGIRGEFRWEVVDEATGEVVESSPLKTNLILNQGFDYAAQRSFVDNVAYCAIGTSTNAPLLTDTGLTAEAVRTNLLDTSIANSALTTLTGNVYAFRRIFKFASTTLSHTSGYGEIGWSYAALAGANLFSKAQLMDMNGNPGSIIVPTGKYLRVYYTISLTLNPSTSIHGPNNIDSFGSVAGTGGLQLIGLKKLNADGTTGNWDAGADCNELYSTVDVFFADSSTALAAFGSTVNRSGSTNYIATPYSGTYQGAGSGVMVKSGTFAKTAANDATLQCMGYGPVASSTTNNGFAFVFDSTVTKDNLHLLTVTFVYTLVRM